MQMSFTPTVFYGETLLVIDWRITAHQYKQVNLCQSTREKNGRFIELDRGHHTIVSYFLF